MKDSQATISATFNGLFIGERDAHQRLSFIVEAKRPDGQVRHISSSARVTDPAHLDRLRREFKFGDQIEITILTEWTKPSAPVTLLSFRPVSRELCR